MGVPLLLVDAFTDGPFSGNPAAVCLLPAWRDDRWLQSLAAEMKHSETAYLVRNADGFDLRWFTPAIEVALCGHATLASAHALWEQGVVPGGRGDSLCHQERHADGHSPQRPDRARLPPQSGRDRRAAGRAVARARRYGPLRRQEPLRLPRRSRVRGDRAKNDARFPAAGERSRSRHDRHQPFEPTRGSISSRGSSPRPRASTRTQSPARPIAAWPRTGRNGWARTSSSRTRRRPAAVSCTFASLTIGCCLGGQAVTVLKGELSGRTVESG